MDPDLYDLQSLSAKCFAPTAMQLTDYLARAEIVQIKVPNPGYENPWLKLAGKYKDDPPFEEMIAEIEADRQNLDANLSDDEAI